MPPEDLFQTITERQGFPLPEAYRQMCARGFFHLDHPAQQASELTQPGEGYLWLNDMEWLPLEEIADRCPNPWKATERSASVPYRPLHRRWREERVLMRVRGRSGWRREAGEWGGLQGFSENFSKSLLHDFASDLTHLVPFALS